MLSSSTMDLMAMFLVSDMKVTELSTKNNLSLQKTLLERSLCLLGVLMRIRLYMGTCNTNRLLQLSCLNIVIKIDNYQYNARSGLTKISGGKETEH